MSDRILVTGAAGFIGSHVCDLLDEMNIDYEGLDDFSTGTHSRPRVYLQNIRMNWKSKFMPTAIIHLAAQPSLIKSEEDPEFDAKVNILGTINMLKKAQRVGCQRFVFASTGAVYHGGNKIVEGKEWMANLAPNTPYGLSKLCAEKYVALMSPEPAILRFANVYGPRQVPLGENQLIPRVLDCIYNKKEFRINGNGKQTRDFVYVEDVARACVMAATQKEIGPAPMNISSGISYSVNLIVDLLRDDCGITEKFEHGDSIRREPLNVLMDNERAKDMLGWRPKTDIFNGLAKTVSWWKENAVSS